MKAAFAAVFTLAVAAGAPSLAGEDFGQFYRPAEGWVGEAVIRDIRRSTTPACVTEDDLNALEYALDDGDQARAQSMADVCVMLANESYGEIIGATIGGDYLHLRMIYVNHVRELDGLEVFVPVMSLRDIGDPHQGLRDTYNKLVGR